MDFPIHKNGTDDIDNGQQNEGRKRFFVDAKLISGGSLLLLKGRKPAYKEWLDKHGTNDFLKRAQKSQRFKDIMVEKIAQLYSLLMVEEEEKASLLETIESRDNTMEHLQNKMIYIQDGLAVEEDAKRRMLLRYIHSVKEQASSSSDGIHTCIYTYLYIFIHTCIYIYVYIYIFLHIYIHICIYIYIYTHMYILCRCRRRA
jgi:hypothetical protein